MTVSSLSSAFVDVGKHYSGRAYRITRVTIHHMAGVMDAAGCARMHRDSGVQASANYYIGNDGAIVCGVDEGDAAWTSADWDNDNRAITMEVSNSYAGGDWPVSAAAWESMIALCADICARYGIEPTYTGGTGGSFTEHRMFAATGCPGEYIHSRMPQIVAEVKARMEGDDDMKLDELLNKAIATGDDGNQPIWQVWSWAFTHAKRASEKISKVVTSVTKLQSSVDKLDARLDGIEKRIKVGGVDTAALAKAVSDEVAKRMKA